MTRADALELLDANERRFGQRIAAVPRAHRRELADALRELAVGVLPIDLGRSLAAAEVADMLHPVERRHAC